MPEEVQVCATCFDRRSVEDALEAEILHMCEMKLINLACLGTTWNVT